MSSFGDCCLFLKHIFIEDLLWARTILGTDNATVTKIVKYTYSHGVYILLCEEDLDNKQINE